MYLQRVQKEDEVWRMQFDKAKAKRDDEAKEADDQQRLAVEMEQIAFHKKKVSEIICIAFN